MTDDSALKRFVHKHFPPGTDPYGADVLERLTNEFQKEMQQKQKVKAL